MQTDQLVASCRAVIQAEHSSVQQAADELVEVRLESPSRTAAAAAYGTALRMMSDSVPASPASAPAVPDARPRGPRWSVQLCGDARVVRDGCTESEAFVDWLGRGTMTQTFQNPLIKEYTLNYNRIPIMI